KSSKKTPKSVMDFDGGFHEIEKDGKLFMVYHHPKYCPIPQIQSPSSSSEGPSHDHPPQPLFLCPRVRYLKDCSEKYHKLAPLKSSPEYVFSTTRVENHHHVLPLFWCNNEKFKANGGCFICYGSNFGTNYYFCDHCDLTFHKECVESPIKIKHPYHPEHSLQLYFYSSMGECLYCGKRACNLVYYRTICQAVMHPICAMRLISFVIDKPKCHDHPLTFFPRQTSLTCNVCSLERKNYPTYVCLRCNFVAHNDCMYSPRIIKNPRYHVTPIVSPTFILFHLDNGFVEFVVNVSLVVMCCDYVAHIRCALGKDVWDEKELEGVPDDDNITQDDGPFDIISKGVIVHFLHDHHLRLQVNILYDENKLCEACVLPIVEGTFYTCIECDFILHETCAKYCRRIQHVLHPHPLTLKPMTQNVLGHEGCDACFRYLGGFFYRCQIEECNFVIDVSCASISEPFDYKGHEHPLFLALDPEVKPICHVCKGECRKQFNCIKCDFIICFTCATLPYKARYKHDKYFLTILRGEEICEKNWCELCECSLKDTDTKVFY
ncbi:unnamed protein product, partial [Thlaspi arvense]